MWLRRRTRPGSPLRAELQLETVDPAGLPERIAITLAIDVSRTRWSHFGHRKSTTDRYERTLGVRAAPHMTS